MALTPFPNAFPAIGSGTFNADAYNWATFMQGTHQTELDALVTAVDTDAATATTQAAAAAVSAAAAASSATAAGAIAWVSGTTYAIGDARFSLLNFQTYRRRTSGAGTTDPKNDVANWAPVVRTPTAAKIYANQNFGGF